MEKISLFKEYIVDGQQSNNEKRHIFYKVDNKQIESAEARMKNKFPSELKEFYIEIGYGFLCKNDKTHTNRIMDPSDIADFYCGDEVYNYVDRDLYDSNEIIFFDLGGEGDFLTIKSDKNNNSAVYYFGRKIADSLKEFLINMNLNTNYYIEK